MAAISYKEQYRREIETLFLREAIFEKTQDFSPEMQEGLLCIISGLSDYHEEGRALYPEVIIVSDMVHLQNQFKHFRAIKIGEISFMNGGPKEFENILKSCAPLAIEGWTIYIELNQYASPPTIAFGLINGEKDVLNEPIMEQIFNKAKKEEAFKANLKFVYLRNIGLKTVLVKGGENEINLAFSVNTSEELPHDAVIELTKAIAKDLKGKLKKKVGSYLAKEINDAINQGHGTLIAVAKENISFDDNNFKGHRLENPINFNELIGKAIESSSPEDYHEIKKYAHIVKAAINNDGITIFSKTGQLLGYHFMIHKDSYEKTATGARSQAFEAMKESGKFSFCFYKSQDGKTKTWNGKS